MNAKAVRSLVLVKQRNKTETSLKSLDADFKEVRSDIMHWSAMREFDNFSEEDQQDLQHELWVFANEKKRYDQIRLLDKDGQEAIRIHFVDGKWEAAPKRELQSKKSRYYFQNALALEPGQIYASPFDLNVEHEQIQMPYKPVMRFAMPIYYGSSRQKGILVFNYRSDYLFDRLEKENQTSEGLLMVVNADGYWLNGPDVKNVFGFVFEGEEIAPYFASKPEIWNAMNNEIEGQIAGRDGLYTFMAFDRLQAVQGVNPPNFHNEKEIARPWKIISFLDSRKLNAEAHKHGLTLLSLFMPIALALAAGCWIAARSRVGRLQAERTLLESQNQLKTVMDSSPSAIYLLEPSGRFLLANDHAKELLGATGEEDLRQKFFSDLFQANNPEDFDKALAHIFELNRPLQTEAVIRRRDGSRLTYLTNLAPLRDKDGNPNAIIGVSTDITQLRRAQSEYESIQERLNQLKKLESVGQLAGGFSHNLNNIMTVVSGAAQLGAMNLEASHPARLEFEKILNAAERAKDLSEKLLAIARKESLHIKPASINEIVENAARMLSVERHGRELIETRLDKSLPNFLLDAGQIQQALLNVMRNGLEAMPDGKTLTVETATVELDKAFCGNLPALLSGRHCRIKVTDSGGGIPEGMLEKIFEPFFSSKGLHQSPGLGLSVALGIVRNHGGDILAESREGEGATFTIYLPIKEMASPAPAAALASADDCAREQTILLVDDEPDVLEIGSRFLKRAGYRILTAPNGKKALEIYENGGVDLVALDMIMPEMGGDEVFRRLKNMDPNVKAIIVSGYSREGSASEALANGALAYVQKPYKYDELLSTVRHALS